jgi:uncharacterized protein involved in outer membrane biogenesis
MKFLPRIFTRWTFWLIVAGVLVAYTAAGFLLVPRIVRSQLVGTIAETYDRQAQVGKVRFNPFTFVLEIEDFAMPDTDGRPLLGFKRLHIDFELISILRRAYSFKAIRLEQPAALAVVRADGSLNLADLAKEKQPPQEPAEPEPEPEGVPRLYIGTFTVDTGRIDFEDLSRSTKFESSLKPITFVLRDFSTTGTGANSYTLDAESTLGERLVWNGTLNANPVSSQGSFTLTNVQAQTLWDYLRDAVAFEVPAGTLELTGHYTFSLEREPIDLEVVGEQITVRGLIVRAKGSEVDDVKLDELVINDARASVADQRSSVAAILIKGGLVQAWLDADGNLSLPRLLKEMGSPTTVEGAATDAAGSVAPGTQPAPEVARNPDEDWVIALPLIETSDIEVAFEDRSIEPVVPIKFAPVNVKLTDYESTFAKPVGLELHVGIDDSGDLQASGTVDLNTDAAAFDVELKDLDLRGFQPYIGRVTDMTLTSGKVGLKGKFELIPAPPDNTLQLKFAGNVDSTKLHTIDNALEEDFIRWDALRVTGLEYDQARSRLVIKEIAARRPYARVIIASDGTVNVTEVLSPERAGEKAPGAQTGESADKSATRDAAEKPLDARIGLVRIDKGSANFADYSLAPFPSFATGIQELSGTVTGLSSKPDSRAKVKLDGKVDAYAPVTIEGDINYLSADTYTDLKLAFDNMELTTFTPYSGKFAGYRIEKGKLSVVFVYKVENRQLNAQHKVVLNQLQLGERVESKDATTLPVKLAVALLKDRNGVIDLDLPVTGSLDDPKFRLGPLIWKVVVNLVTKIVTAPFALIGSLFGGGEQVNQLTFTPGGSTLQGESNARIESVAKALKDRPGLELEIPMAMNPELDRPLLQKGALDEHLVAVKRRELVAKRKPVDTLDATVLADRNEYYRLLNEFALQQQVITEDEAKENRKKKPKPEDLEFEITALEDKVRPAVEVPDTALADLGRQRAQVVQDLLLASGEIEPARVFVITGEPAPNEGGLVRMDLSLR